MENTGKTISYVIVVTKQSEYKLLDLKEHSYEIINEKVYLDDEFIGKIVRKGHSKDMMENILDRLEDKNEIR